MLYVDYVILRQSYDMSQKRLGEIINQKEAALTKTLPKAIRYDVAKVIHSPSLISPLDEYVMAVERIDQQIRSMRIIIDERNYLLMLKTEQLKTSLDEFDRIFVMYYLKKLPAEHIASVMGYSKDSIYYKKNKMVERLEKENISLEEMFGRR